MASSCLSKSHAIIIEKLNTFSFGSSLSSLSVMKKNYMLVCCRNNGSVRSANRPLQTLKNLKIRKMDFICSDAKEPASILVDYNNGLGIVGFLKGKRLLITGATGFLAKAFIEKILRTSPDVDKIYVLIRAKNKEAAMDRLKSEIVNIELFSSLRETHGNDYQDFMLRKLIPVVGDVRKAGMGIEATLSDEISEEVDVIVNSAANTTFDERYDVALDINTIGPYRLMSFAKRFKRLKLFVQVSTAYVNGERQGRILEKPFCIGDTIAREKNSSEFSVKTIPLVDIETEIKLAFSSGNATSDASLIREMKDLGLARSKMHGWQDTYGFTKAMGEMVINSMRGDIPVVTIRPSVIESTFKEPFPGWIEGNRMMDPIILYYGKGKLTSFLADPDGVLDVVPADMVINATLAAMAKHGQGGDPGMHVYHIASSVENPLVFQDLARSSYEHFNASPCIDSNGKPIVIPPFKLFNDTHKFLTYILSDIMQRSEREGKGDLQEKISQRLKNMLMKSVEQVKYLATIYEPYTFYGGRFDNTNTQKLATEMSDEEMRSFGFDV